ncbi:hypothetical protein A1O3_07952 [Capronia epimyces CBS 606.96]|uniref:Ubiquitin interaction motif protein n=1 Tax=Capronia epimyces CBS 606.96 TaxID=1182542 RepID=W9XGM7_9EURO|nr:uncharacterized protein A1O3_07952 [Capronia epimyces CBS 606.96]EXJ79672.1 hypothetical protein A1O3_07952 [Capronia epimyces CBS 606.96]
MSRPPSRADNNRPLLDLSSDHATASASAVKTLKEQEEMNDPALQRAMEESLRQNLPAQENGVTVADTHFGPAVRDYYDPSNWAMTTFSSSREIVDHPAPSKRRRIGDEPAFLRGSKETDYLGPLLTIYHSIPLAREALLMPSLKIHNYGYDGSWWSGSSNENTKAISADSALQIDKDDCNLLAEVQCLMAFLDGTNRAYGSIDALADLQAVRRTNEELNFLRCLTAWSNAALRQAPQEQLTQIFTSVAMKNTGPGDSPPEERSLLHVQAPINRIPGESLVDLLDHTVWNDAMGILDDVWIDRCAEVFTVQVRDPNNGKSALDLTIDPLWYPDRYMYECREVMQHIRKQLQLIRREIEQCTNIQRRCEVLKLPDKRVLKTREVLDAAAKISTVAVSPRSISNSRFTGPAGSTESSVTQPDLKQIKSELNSIVQRIGQKLQSLEQKKTELNRKSRQIALNLTKPTPQNPNFPYRKYTLQGVSTKPEITYLRLPNKDLLHLDDDQDNSGGSAYQWWRCSWLQDDSQTLYPSVTIMGPVTQAQAEAAKREQNASVENNDGDGGSKPYSVSKISESEVLEAARREHSSVLLVYANENAMHFKGSELSRPLRIFVDRDNQAFTEELQQEAGSLSNLAGEGEIEAEFEDVPLIDRTRSSSSAREFTPMSTSTPGRDEDGQPSPKRARGGYSPKCADQPPSYEESVGKQEMQERRGNKIGLYAEQMLQKYGEEANQSTKE